MLTAGLSCKCNTEICIYLCHMEVKTHSFRTSVLTLNLLTAIVAPPSNASKWQMGFNSAFKGLMELMSILNPADIYTKKINLYPLN